MRKALSMLAAIAALALGSFFAAPASATNMAASCHFVSHGNPPSTSFPTGNVWSCARTYPTNSAEANAVTANEKLLWEVYEAEPHAPNSNHLRDFLQQYDVHVYFFSTEEDARDTLQALYNVSWPALSDYRSGLTFSSPVGTTTRRVTAVWNHWRASGTTSIQLQDFRIQGRSLQHEFGHHMDRIWALTRSPALNYITANDPRYVRALQLDAQNLTAADITELQTKYPRLYSSTGVVREELFAEQFAVRRGGGVRSDEDQFINQTFTCSNWYVFSLYNSNGSPSANPNLSPTACYGFSQ